MFLKYAQYFCLSYSNEGLHSKHLEGGYRLILEFYPYFTFDLDVDLKSFNFNRLYLILSNLDEKVKGLAAKARNKELLEAGVFKIVSHGTGKFGRVLGEVFVSPDAVGHEVAEGVDRSSDGLVSINDILINEGHAYEYSGGKKKDFKAEIAKEKAAKKEDLVDKPAEEA